MRRLPASLTGRSRSQAGSASRQLAALTAIVAFVDFMFGATYVYLLMSAGFSGTTIGFLISGAGLVSTIFEIPSGAIGDRFGQRRILIIGLIAWGLGLGVFSFARGVAPFSVGLVLWAIGMALYGGAPSALVVNTLGKLDRMDLMPRAIRNAQTAKWLASALGAATVLVAGARFDPSVLITTGGAILLITSGWVLLRWPQGSRIGDFTIVENLSAGIKYAVGPAREPIVFVFLIGLAQSILLIAWQPLILQGLGWSERSLGAVLLVLTIAAALGLMTASRTERWPRAVVNGAAVVFISSGLLVAAMGGPWVVIGLLVAELAIGCGLAVNAVWAHSLFSDELRNTLTSIDGAVFGLALSLGDVLFGLLWDSLGLLNSVALMGGASIALTLAGMGILRLLSPSGGRGARCAHRHRRSPMRPR